MHLRDLKAIFFEDVTQLGISDRIDVRGDLFTVVVVCPQAFYLPARHRFEVRGVTIQQPFQTFLDIQNVWNADSDGPARAQYARELTHCLLWILNVLQAFEAGDMIE